uniref:Uncharacterized protein n=1 Tax=Amphimedon queenslandica TaxID=400682 RepID=A0A1X7UQR7_AMPQE
MSVVIYCNWKLNGKCHGVKVNLQFFNIDTNRTPYDVGEQRGYLELIVKTGIPVTMTEFAQTNSYQAHEHHERLKARCERRYELNDVNRMEQVVMQHETSSSINDTCISIEELVEARQENKALKKQLSNPDAGLKEVKGRLLVSDFDVLQNVPIVLKRITGILDWDVFKALYDLVESDLPVGPKLSKLNNLMMFLRVRFSYGIEDLAFRFSLSKGQINVKAFL